MKTKPAASEKPAREPRTEWIQATYSQGALDMMEQATGIRMTRVPPPFKPPAPAKDDA